VDLYFKKEYQFKYTKFMYEDEQTGALQKLVNINNDVLKENLYNSTKFVIECL